MTSIIDRTAMLSTPNVGPTLDPRFQTTVLDLKNLQNATARLFLMMWIVRCAHRRRRGVIASSCPVTAPVVKGR